MGITSAEKIATTTVGTSITTGMMIGTTIETIGATTGKQATAWDRETPAFGPAFCLPSDERRRNRSQAR
jgi:hypothetical protein